MRDATAQQALDKFGAALRTVCQRQGKTRAQLADATGLHRTTLAAIEHGLRDPRFDTLMKLRRGLGDGLSDVFAMSEAAADGPLENLPQDGQGAGTSPATTVARPNPSGARCREQDDLLAQGARLPSPRADGR